MLVVGVDGCKKGWVAMATKDGKVHEARVFSEFRELTDAYRNAKVIAVDIPIGLPKQSHREADLTARELLGKRRSSLFLTPPRPVLAVPTYREARKVAQKMGWTVTAQAHGLHKKILEVESFAARDKRIFEAHPLFELSFRAMAGSPLQWGKKTWNGFHERVHLLEKDGIVIPDTLAEAGSKAGPDDVLDAAAAAWTAGRLARKKGKSTPETPTQKWKGRPIAIWY